MLFEVGESKRQYVMWGLLNISMCPFKNRSKHMNLRLSAT